VKELSEFDKITTILTGYIEPKVEKKGLRK
jgi:hypothetical protein